MGYNTRRKSLSLTELGIVLPKRSRAQSHPSPPSTIAEEGEESERPSKKCRVMSPPAIKQEKKPGAQLPQLSQLSPPPSPAAEGRNQVDVEGINDDVVVGTIQQLEATGNRPHLVKELAAILACSLHSVEKYDAASLHSRTANILRRSANPCALISSRLTSYLHRPWPTVSPCPLAKDIAPVHPRRLYFFLTTQPRQPIPETVEPLLPRIISPSLSSASAADEEEERYTRPRHTLSPSPEVDLSSPELEQGQPQEPPTPGAPFSGRNSVTRERSTSASNLAQGRRGGSPQLEHEERDFKLCANALYEQAQMQRRNSLVGRESPDVVKMEVTDDVEYEAEVAMSIEEDEAAARKNSEVAAALFGQAEHLKPMEGGLEYCSSPLIQPRSEVTLDAVPAKGAKREGGFEGMVLDLHIKDSEVDAVTMADCDWDSLLSPENVDVAELEDLFDAY